MIELVYQNEIVLIYKIKDWEQLRSEFRIVGNVLGSTQYVPAMPCELSSEETMLLLEKGIAKLVAYDDINQKLLSDEEYKKMQVELLHEEKKIYKHVKRNRIECYIDKIVEGKRKKGDERNKDEIFEEELERACELDMDNMLWPIMLQRCSNRQGREMTIDEFGKQTNLENYPIFKDLWEKGFYLTTGHKFGGDFLVYTGDPIMHHATFIIRCMSKGTDTMCTRELVAFGRLGMSVKKKSVLALNHPNGVKYITISWREI